MRWPTLLSRKNPNVHKNDFGHVLILAGSQRFLGAAALSSLAAMRAGAGLVTVGVPRSLNAALQKKISPVIMTLPLEETKEGTLAITAFKTIQKHLNQFDVIALGPGLTTHPSTSRLIIKIISTFAKPFVIDADGLNIVSQKPEILSLTSTPKILTPHPGEMARLTKLTKSTIEGNRNQTASGFAKKYHCTLLLKGPKTVVASSEGKIYINTTGNPGMAKAGSGDVLTGIIAAFRAQGLDDFTAATLGAYVHGLAGDLAAKTKTRLSMIATDTIDNIPQAVKSLAF
jgi:ADP-dependent NAD(P)H-hydrate dehydratase / NAD(P)H-hydrate epimerase